MAEIRFPDLSWPSFCARCCSFSDRRRENIPFWLVARLRTFPSVAKLCGSGGFVVSLAGQSSITSAFAANFRLCTKTPSTITGIFGSLIFRLILGIASTRKSVQAHGQVTGKTSLLVRNGCFHLKLLRMAIWKHFIVLFGGFYDPGVTSPFGLPPSLAPLLPHTGPTLNGSNLARYLNDLWLFDLQEYKWRQIEFRETDTRPS